MPVDRKASSSSFKPKQVSTTRNMSGMGGGPKFDSAKQSKPHTVNRSTKSAHTGSASAGSAVSVYRSGQSK